MKRILLSSLLLISSFGFAQEPVIEWQKSLGGTDYDGAQSIQQTTDGGYIVAGYSGSNDGDLTGNIEGKDLWVIKLNALGNITWQKSLGGSQSEFAESIQQTTDGGYIVAGYTGSNDGDVTGHNGSNDYWVVKLDVSGNITWQKSLGGSGVDVAQSIQQTTDGGYIVAGYSESNDGDVTGNHGSNDYWVVKLDGSGNIAWQKSLGGTGDDGEATAQQTTDGGYIVAGKSLSNDGDVMGNHGSYDFWLVKLDDYGNITWQKSLGGTLSDRALSVSQTSGGGYIVAGTSFSNDGDVTGNNGEMDYWVVKLDGSGNIAWQKSLGGSGWDLAHSIQQTTDGGFIITGFTASNDGDVTESKGYYDWWVVKIDVSGNIVWQKSLGGSEYDRAESIQQTTDGGYIVAGWSESNDGDVTENNGFHDSWVVKLSSESVSVFENVKTELKLYPNPTTKTFTISSENAINSEFKIINAEGKEVFSGKMNGKEQTVDISGLSKGVYSIVFENSELPVLSVIKE